MVVVVGRGVDYCVVFKLKPVMRKTRMGRSGTSTEEGYAPAEQEDEGHPGRPGGIGNQNTSRIASRRTTL